MADLTDAAKLIMEADGLIITAGAGIGADSGLPIFRGTAGLWKAHPGLQHQRMNFSDIARPAAFRSVPDLAWGFYGDRLTRYREVPPHAGFAMLLEIAGRLRQGAFIFTSNVDGHFQKAGFSPDRILECHGSIHYLQCLDKCQDHVWPADEVAPLVDDEECRLLSPLPVCPDCGRLARPNVLMFGDGGWNSRPMSAQLAKLEAWVGSVEKLVVIEIGAGTNIPTVRDFSERLACPLIRINPDDSELLPKDGIAVPYGALEGITLIRQSLEAVGLFNS